VLFGLVARNFRKLVGSRKVGREGEFLSFVINTRWFKYDRDKLWLVYTQSVPVIFEPPCRTLGYQWTIIIVIII
jgi:hypothetical protein